jgi:hypothetical protein
MTRWVERAAEGSGEGRDPTATRETLTQVLTLESRNALSRVELAASELVRLETNPASRERLAAIREAVGELDVLLEKLALLWAPRIAGEARVVDLGALVDAVCGRIAPTLQARGISIERRSRVCRCRLGITPVALERLLLCFLRLGVGAITGAERLRLETRMDGEGIGVLLCRTDERGGVLWRVADPAQRLELELQLAELGGRLADPTGEETLRLWIPGRCEVDA